MRLLNGVVAALLDRASSSLSTLAEAVRGAGEEDELEGLEDDDAGPVVTDEARELLHGPPPSPELRDDQREAPAAGSARARVEQARRLRIVGR